MQTYFLHDCLYRWRNEFNRWARPRQQAMEVTFHEFLEGQRNPRAFEEQVLVREAIEKVLKKSPSEVRAIVSLLYQGPWTQPEIGAQLQLSTRSMEGYMRRLRNLAKAMQDRGEIDLSLSIPAPRAGER